jgi:cellulose biosynthesis protein BcsQ
MTKVISIFNNKGGVGKTTYMYHIAHLLARRKLSVLMVDCDSQCNLTAYSLQDSDIKKAWSEDGNASTGISSLFIGRSAIFAVERLSN